MPSEMIRPNLADVRKALTLPDFNPAQAQIQMAPLYRPLRRPDSVPGKPHVSRGHPDLIAIGAVRAAVGAAACYSKRVAIVGHRVGGYGLTGMIFGYPRLARAVVAVESVPARIKPKGKLASRMPAFLFLAGEKRVLEITQKYKKDNPKLHIDVAALRRAANSSYA